MNSMKTLIDPKFKSRRTDDDGIEIDFFITIEQFLIAAKNVLPNKIYKQILMQPHLPRQVKTKTLFYSKEVMDKHNDYEIPYGMTKNAYLDDVHEIHEFKYGYGAVSSVVFLPMESIHDLPPDYIES